jgi:hypothetical protein
VVALVGAVLAPAASAKLAFKTTDTPLSYSSQDVAIGSLDGKNGPDMVIADATNGAVHVYLNKGNGAFKAPKALPACAGAREVLIGKLNGDSAQDLLVFCGGSTVSLLGNGSGGFAAARDAGSVAGQGSLALGHINTAAGGLDVAFRSYEGLLCQAIGKGNGKFTQPICAQDPNDLHYVQIGQLTLGDISGDGKAEAIAFAQHNGAENVAFFRFDIGDCPLTGYCPDPSYRPTGSSGGRAIVARDLDKDGDLDVITGETPGKIGVLKAGANGIPPSATAKLYNAGPGLDDMALGDFDGDHKLDAASVWAGPSSNPADGTVEINTGNGNGTFDSPPKGFPAGLNGGTHYIAAGDLNRDGRSDAAVVEYQGKLSVLLSK